MSNITPIQNAELTPAQLELVRSTIAKGATNDELKLFAYRCQHMGLDPLKPGQIHFVKYGNSPGAIIIGREGFRVRAAKTGKHAGTKIGVIRNEKDEVIGAWCEVYRTDWTQPAREEVFLEEYNTGKAQWAKMPITMIKKVAECAALRMAFPDELGGLYSKEEMDQAEPQDQAPTQPPQVEPTQPRDVSPISKPERVATDGLIRLGQYKIPGFVPKIGGQLMADCEMEALKETLKYWESRQRREGKKLSGVPATLVENIAKWIDAHSNQDSIVDALEEEFPS